MPLKPSCLIVGAGDGVGSAIARAFAREGLAVCITRRARNLEPLEAVAAAIRADGGEAHAFGVDARMEAEMVALIDRIESDIGPLQVVVFNIGANVRFPVVETTAQVYSKVWEMAALAGFFTGREAARVMTARGKGTILFTGATASTRGGAGCTDCAGGCVPGSLSALYILGQRGLRTAPDLQPLTALRSVSRREQVRRRPVRKSFRRYW